MGTAELQERKRQVLRAVIEAYITQAAPVSSQAICDRLGVSSATVRNVMAELEADGFIMHPHTSAGRVPTEQGYRHFVDVLMEQSSPTAEEAQAVQALFSRDYHAFGELLERASRVLSSMTGQLAVGVAPALGREALQRFEAVPLGAGKVLGILRTTDGFVHSHVVDLREELEADELVRLLRFINAELAGVELAQVEALLTRRLLAQQDALFYLMKQAMTLLQASMQDMAEERLYYDGLGHLVIQPEFRTDMARVCALVEALELRAPLVTIMEEDLTEPGLQVVIGREHRSAALHECSTVSATYGLGGHALGRIAVVGPKRMAYAKVSSLVDAVAQRMSEYLTRAFRE